MKEDIQRQRPGWQKGSLTDKDKQLCLRNYPVPSDVQCPEGGFRFTTNEATIGQFILSFLPTPKMVLAKENFERVLLRERRQNRSERIALTNQHDKQALLAHLDKIVEKFDKTCAVMEDSIRDALLLLKVQVHVHESSGLMRTNADDRIQALIDKNLGAYYFSRRLYRVFDGGQFVDKNFIFQEQKWVTQKRTKK